MKQIMWILTAGLLLTAGNAWAQNGTDLGDLLPSGMVAFEPRYISDGTFRKMMNVLDIRFDKFEEVNNRVYVKFPNAGEAERAKRLIQKIDIPPKRIGVQLQFILVTDDVGVGDPVDQKVLAQLKQVFRFGGYRVLSSGYLVVDAGEDGEMSLKGISAGTDLSRYRATFEPQFIDDGKGVIQLEDFEIERVYFDKEGDEEEAKVLGTTLNIKNGDTVIVGSTNVADQVYITIVTATIQN